MGGDFRRRIAVAGGTALLGLGAFVLVGRGEAPPVGEPAPVVQTFTVGAAGTVGEAVADGQDFAAIVRHDREANLSFRVAGRLSALPVRHGQRLPAGALVAAIEPATYAAGVDRQAAEVARLERATERYAGLVPEGAVAAAQARDARDALTAARAALNAARYDLASSRLVMPFTGTVLSRSAETGETVTPGQPLSLIHI